MTIDEASHNGYYIARVAMAKRGLWLVADSGKPRHLTLWSLTQLLHYSTQVASNATTAEPRACYACVVAYA